MGASQTKTSDTAWGGDVDAPFNIERPAGLAEQVSDRLVEAISLGQLVPGARMVEADIAARFDVSRVPVREAFKILATQGIIEAEPHRGVRVAAVDDLTIDRICEARLAIETMAVSALAGDDTRRAALERDLDVRVAVMAQRVEARDLVGINRADIAFHTDVCRVSGNKIAFTLWQAIARHVRIVFGREILSESSVSAIVQHHRDLARILVAGDAPRAVAALRAHVLRLRRSGLADG